MTVPRSCFVLDIEILLEDGSLGMSLAAYFYEQDEVYQINKRLLTMFLMLRQAPMCSQISCSANKSDGGGGIRNNSGFR